MNRVIRIEPLAPAKPAAGEPCNGCGVCCLAEPCPVGIVISGRLSGPCRALQWDAQSSLYRCGAMGHAAAGAAHARGSALWARARAAWVGRWIGAGRGCDCSLEVDGARVKPDASSSGPDGAD